MSNFITTTIAVIVGFYLMSFAFFLLQVMFFGFARGSDNKGQWTEHY